MLAGPYWNTQFDEDLWKALPDPPDFGTFSVTGSALVELYVEGIRGLADTYNCVFVDFYTPIKKCTWLLSDDQCHFNDIGHRILGNLVFHGIAANCSFIGKKSLRLSREGGFGTENTGGTNGMSRMIDKWLKR